MTVWSPKDDAELHRLYVVEGLSATVTAMHMPSLRSRNAVIGRANRLGFVRDPMQQMANNRAASRARGPRVPLLLGQRKQHFKERVRPAGEPVESPLAGPWMARTAHQCAFPVGDVGGADQWSCCNPVAPGANYCTGHQAIMFNGAPKPNTFAATKAHRSPNFKEWAA